MAVITLPLFSSVNVHYSRRSVAHVPSTLILVAHVPSTLILYSYSKYTSTTRLVHFNPVTLPEIQLPFRLNA